MEFKAKLNFKFYIVALLLLGVTIFVWYGLYFLSTNEILMENNTPMDARTKMIFTAVIGLIVLSWTFSFFTLIRQILFGCAFVIDERGINSTATAMKVLAFIFVVPIGTIPFSAIEQVTEENGVLTLYIDKSKIDIIPVFRIFVSKKYHFFSGFTAEKQDYIKAELKRYMR